MRTVCLGAALGSSFLFAVSGAGAVTDPRDRTPDSVAAPRDEIERAPAVDPEVGLFGGRVRGDLNVDLGFTDDPDSPFGDAESDTFLSVDFSGFLTICEGFWLIADASLGSNGDKATNALFDEPAIALNELYLYYEVLNDEFAIFAGRLEPEFEISFGQADGVIDIGFRNDYEFGGVLAAGAEYYFDVLDYPHKVSATAMMADRTVLSQTLINDTPRLREREGGLANTDAPESFVVRLAGAIDVFDYALAVRRQEDRREEAEIGDEVEASHDETALLFGVGAYVLSDDELGSLRLAFETVHINNFDGENEDAAFWSFDASYELDRLAVGVSHTQRDVDGADVDNFTVASAEYDIGHGFYAGAEVARIRELDDVRTAWGAQLSYRVGF